MTLERPARILTVEVVKDHVLRLTFADGLVKTVDIGPLMRGPIFAPMRDDPAEFGKVTIDPEWDTVMWPNGADLCPDLLYYDRAPAWAEDAPGDDRSA